MGRSQKWPDLRSPISKIKDIRFVGTDDLIIFQKFHNFTWNIVAVARWESYFVVGSLDLTWWPDLTWPWDEIFTKVAEKMGVRWVKTRRRCAPPFFLLSSKNLRGGVQTPPPAGRGLIKRHRKEGSAMLWNRQSTDSVWARPGPGRVKAQVGTLGSSIQRSQPLLHI